MYKIFLPFLVLALVVGAAIMREKPRPRADFVFINRGDVTTLDLQKMSWMQDLRVATILFEGLVRSDVLSWEYTPLPGVAERWEVSPDGRTYTFHLRDDAKWVSVDDEGKPHERGPVRAQDFVYTWRRGLLPDTVSDYAALFQLIDGGAEFYAWRERALKDFKPEPGDSDPSRPLEETAAGRLWAETESKFAELVGLKALDDRTLQVRLVRPTPYFLDLCGFGVFYPVYPPLVEQYERPQRDIGRLDVQPGWTKPGVIVTNGAFTLDAWRFKRGMRLNKNPAYWDAASINIDSMEIPSVEDPNAQVLAYNSGAVDWVSEMTLPYRADMLADKAKFYDECRAARKAWEEGGEGGRVGEEPADVDAMIAAGWDPIAIDRALPDDPRKNIHAFPAFGTYFYNFNCMPRLPDGRDNPFADKRVRQAFVMAVDKQRITRDVRRVGERVATSLIPPGSLAGYQTPEGLPYDPERARATLAEAGYPGGEGLPTIEILFNRDGGHDLVAQAVAKDWQENLGVNVTLAMKEIKVFRDDLKHHNFIVARGSWYGDYGDPTTFLELNRTDDGNNDRVFSNAEYDGLLDKAASETDPQKRLAILAQAEKLLMDDQVPLLAIFHYVQTSIFDPDIVSGVSTHPRQEQHPARFDMLGDGKGAEQAKSMPPAVGGGKMTQRTGAAEAAETKKENAR